MLSWAGAGLRSADTCRTRVRVLHFWTPLLAFIFRSTSFNFYIRRPTHGTRLEAFRRMMWQRSLSPGSHLPHEAACHPLLVLLAERRISSPTKQAVCLAQLQEVISFPLSFSCVTVKGLADRSSTLLEPSQPQNHHSPRPLYLVVFTLSIFFLKKKNQTPGTHAAELISVGSVAI